MLTKSEMSNGWPGVVGKRLPPPGVVIIDEGSARSFLGGGVEGGSIRVLVERTAGEGEGGWVGERPYPPTLAVMTSTGVGTRSKDFDVLMSSSGNVHGAALCDMGQNVEVMMMTEISTS